MHGSFDAIVVGGGPAGGMAGLLLAQRGWRIAIVERGGRNRNKTCGHCLSPRALPILARAGLRDAVKRISAGSTNRLRVYAGGRDAIDVALGGDGGDGLLVERSAFDQLLLDRAAECGAEVIHGAVSRIGSVRRGSQEVTVTSGGEVSRRILAAPLILGADGLGSWVARAFGVAPVRAGRKFGFSFDLPNTRLEQPYAINMFVIDGGYLGLVEQRDGTLHAAGLVGSLNDSMPREPFAFCRAMAQQFTELQSIGLHRTSRRDARSFTAAGPMPWRPRSIAGPGFALLGDAAGYVEPFTGEGICWAMQSAEALAEVAGEARPGAWSEQLASRFAALWCERIGRAQRRCARIAWGLERPWAIGAARWLAIAQPAFARRFARKVVAP